jgi:hypothetical protein
MERIDKIQRGEKEELRYEKMSLPSGKVPAAKWDKLHVVAVFSESVSKLMASTGKDGELAHA